MSRHMVVQLHCDRRGCPAKVVAASADAAVHDAREAGWHVVGHGRRTVELCPKHREAP